MGEGKIIVDNFLLSKFLIEAVSGGSNSGNISHQWRNSGTGYISNVIDCGNMDIIVTSLLEYVAVKDQDIILIPKAKCSVFEKSDGVDIRRGNF